MTAILITAVAGTGASTGHLSERGVDSFPEAPSSRDSGGDVVRSVTLAVPRSEKCHARKGLRFYVRRHNEWRSKMGAVSRRTTRKFSGGCPLYLARLWKRKAFAMRQRYERWRHYHYAWTSWLPDKWARIGACETGYGQRPGRWDWNSGTYQGAFGFYHGSWDAFVPRADRKAGPYPSEAYNATPRQQYEVALAIWRAYGFSGWGCRGA